MVLFILGIILFVIFAFLCRFTTEEEKEGAWMVNIALVIMTIALIATSVRENPKWNTEIVHRYQKGDYQLELKVDGDKVDTLYIFK